MEFLGTIPEIAGIKTENPRSIQEHVPDTMTEAIANETVPLLKLEAKRPGNAGGTPHTLIRDPQRRKQIRAEKQTKVLQWLKTEIYSSPEILALVLGFTHRQSVHKTLTAMQEYGLLRQGRVAIVGGHQMLWGITEHGQAMACPDPDEEPSPRVFEAGRISALRLRHILGLQKLKWQAMQAGWTGWKNCDRGVKPRKRNQKLEHRPDALVINPAGRVVAIELELTFKTIKRYAEEVIPAHADQIYVEENYHHVLWVCPTAEDVKRMSNLIWQASKKIKESKSDAMEQLEAFKQQTGVKRVFWVGSLDGWVQQWEGRVEDRSKNLRAYLWTRFQDATKERKDLESQAHEEQEWMAPADHSIIQQTLSDYRQALKQQEAKRIQQEQEQRRKAEEADRRYAEQLAAQQEAARRANTLVGKISKVLGK